MRLLLGSLSMEAGRESEMFADIDIVSLGPQNRHRSGDCLRGSQIGRVGVKMRYRPCPPLEGASL